jgi:hypothetical protein
MRVRDVFVSLAGSTVVYVAMAACSSGGGGTSSSKVAGAGASAPIHVGAGGAVASTGASGTGTPGAGGAASSGTTGGVASTGATGTPGAGGMASTGATGASGAGGTGPITDSGLLDALMNPVPPAMADPTNGQRLKATYRQGEDGSKEFVAGVWFDSGRNENCSFALASDGKLRCLPNGQATSVYADSQCTTAIVMGPAGCTAPSYAIGMDNTTCGTGGAHVYKIGAAAAPTTVYASAQGQCFSAGPAATGYSYYSVGAEIPASSFVSANVGHD